MELILVLAVISVVLAISAPTLRGFFARAQMRRLDAAALKTFGETLSRHVRTEERRLFEECQRRMPADEMARIGIAMDEYFAKCGMPGATCALPSSLKNKQSE